MVADNLVEIASYSFPHEAQISKASLEAAGIPVFLADEHTINMQWMFSDALGGVRLLVRDVDAATAREILATDYSELVDAIAAEHVDEPESGKITHCPRCNSANLEAATAGPRRGFLDWLVQGVPLLVSRPGLKCRACGEFIRQEGA